MKQMTKEELIEYFIEQLGDNEILGQVMTIEQIREKLNAIIKDVRYADDIKIFNASWQLQQDGTGIVNFDINKIAKDQERRIIVHELLHALSTTVITTNKNNNQLEKRKEKSGLQIFSIWYFSDGETNTYSENVAINEGLIDFLAVQITGIKNPGYEDEKNVYQLLSQVIGSNVMLKKAFITEVSTSLSARDLFKEDLLSEYGDDLGVKLNESVKKILALSDQLLDLSKKNSLYGLNENGRRIQKETKKEKYETITLMMEQVIENEQDLEKLFDIASAVQNIYEIRNKLQKKLYNRIYDLYVEREKISDTTFSKRKIFERCFKLSMVPDKSEFDSRLAKVKYRQVGEYYEVFGIYKKGTLYNSDGLLIEKSGDDTLWSFSPDNEEVVDEFDREKLLSIVDEDNISILLEQLKTKAREFNDLTETSQNNEGNYMDVSVIGNVIKLDYGNYYEFYSVNSDGTLNVIEPRRRKKIYR